MNRINYLLGGPILFLVCMLLASPCLACDDTPGFACRPVPTAERNSSFSDEVITIFASEWLEWASHPQSKGETQRVPKAVLTVSGKHLHDQVMKWIDGAEEYRFPNREAEDVMNAVFVLEVRKSDGQLRKTFVSDGCLIEDDSGKLFSIAAGMQTFLAGLTAADSPRPNCKYLETPAM